MGVMDWLGSKNEALASVEFATKEMDAASEALYAEQMINNPIYNKVLGRMKEQLTLMWQDSETYEQDNREDIYRSLKILSAIDKYIKACVALVLSRQDENKIHSQ